MVIYGLNLSSFQEKKTRTFCPAGPFFLVLYIIVYQSDLIPRKLRRPKKFLITRVLKKFILKSFIFCAVGKNKNLIFFTRNTNAQRKIDQSNKKKNSYQHCKTLSIIKPFEKVNLKKILITNLLSRAIYYRKPILHYNIKSIDLICY